MYVKMNLCSLSFSDCKQCLLWLLLCKDRFKMRVRDSSADGLSFSFSLFFFRQIISNGSIKTFEQKCFGGKIELNGIHFVLTTLNEMPPGTIWSLATICLAKYQLPSPGPPRCRPFCAKETGKQNNRRSF